MKQAFVKQMMDIKVVEIRSEEIKLGQSAYGGIWGVETDEGAAEQKIKQ